MQTIKEHQGRKYTGSPVGFEHKWDYTNCEVEETKRSPDEWSFRMTSIKRKQIPTNKMGSIEPGTEYHWFFIGDQKVRKIDSNSYETELTATKYKLGHKRPYWKKFSYQYKEQKSITQQKLDFLNRQIQETAKKDMNTE